MRYEKRAIRALGLQEQPVQSDGQTADGMKWADGTDAGIRVEIVTSKRLSITALKKKLEQAESKTRAGALPIAVGVDISGDKPRVYALIDEGTLKSLLQDRKDRVD